MEGASVEKQRGYFRVDLGEEIGRLTVDGMGQRAFPPGHQEVLRVTVHNVSAGGILLSCDRDLNIRLDLWARVEFTVDGEPFDLRLRFLRKTDTRTTYEYACEFPAMSENDRSRLTRALNQLELARRLGAGGRR